MIVENNHSFNSRIYSGCNCLGSYGIMTITYFKQSRRYVAQGSTTVACVLATKPRQYKWTVTRRLNYDEIRGKAGEG